MKECYQQKNKKCRFGEQNCWFHHGEEIDKPTKDNKEITKKLFSMIETFTNRIVEIEKHINDKN